MSLTVAASRSLPTLHDRFAPVHDAVRRIAGRAGHAVRNRHDREDLVAEALLVAWQRFLACAGDPRPVEPRTLARHAVVVAYRLVCRNLLAAA